MIYYVVIDTNVVVSALLNKNSNPGRVVGEALHGDVIPVVNDEILAEYDEVLHRPKFKLDQNVVSVFLDEFKSRAVFVDEGVVDDVVLDVKDVVFYAVLMEVKKKEEAWLVTGNIRHFPVRTFVVTPREMLDILQSNR